MVPNRLFARRCNTRRLFKFPNPRGMEHVKYISDVICYTMLYILEWMQKEKYSIRTPRTRELHGSTILTYAYGEIP